MRFASIHGFYELNPFPGCNQLVVSNHAFIFPQSRDKGKGQEQAQERITKAHDLGYDYMIATVKEDNLKQKHIMAKNGWACFTKFRSRETGSTIEIWGRPTVDSDPVMAI